MFYIFCAMYSEAAKLIRDLNLKKVQCVPSADSFTDHQSVFLSLTGSGQLNAASVTAAVLSRSDIQSDDILISYGSSASLDPDIREGFFQLNKIREIHSGRCYYPDLILHTGLQECGALCGNHIYQGEEYSFDDCILYDMESAAVYHAAKMYFSPDRMLFMRFVSDNGNTCQLNDQKIREMAASSSDELITIMKTIAERKPYEKSEDVFSEEEKKEIEQLSDLIRCSANMKNELHNCFYYAKLNGESVQEVLQAVQIDTYLPVKEKEEGKRILHEIRKHVME